VPKTYRPHLSTARDARAVRTRLALRTALLKLLQRKSWDRISVRDIAAAARVGYATFFRHFPGKDSLLQAVASDEIAQLIELTMPVLDTTDSRAASLALCRYVESHRALWLVLLTGGAAGVLRDEFMRASIGCGSSRRRRSSVSPRSSTASSLRRWCTAVPPRAIPAVII